MDDPENVLEVSMKSKTDSAKRKREEESDLLNEVIEPRSSLPPLFMKLSERHAETLDYIGVSFGVTEKLLKFWKKAEFVPVYLRQTTNDITGEHTCIMIHKLNSEEQQIEKDDWLQDYWVDFRMRFIDFLSSFFREYSSSFALSILENKVVEVPATTLTKNELAQYLTLHNIGRLEKYSNNMSDYREIMDLVQPLARLYFLRRLGSINLLQGEKNKSLQISAVQAAILLGIGLQRKSIDDLAKELNLQSSQLLGLFNKIIKKFTSYLNSLVEESIRNSMN